MSVTTLEKPTKARCDEVFATVKEVMKRKSVTFAHLASALGQSQGTARNVLTMGTSNPDQYVAISKALGKPSHWLQDLMVGDSASNQSNPAVSDIPEASPAKPKNSGRRKQTTNLSRSATAKVAPAESVPGIWSPAEVPEMPLGPAGGKLASGLAALQIRVEELEREAVANSEWRAACTCSASK